MKSQLKRSTKLRQEALHLRKVADNSINTNSVDLQLEAIFTEAAASELECQVPASQIISGEVVLSEAELPDTAGGWALRDTLASPDTAAIVASMERTDLLMEGTTDVLALAIDAAQSIPHASSLEKMLAHQMALAHKASFKLIELAMQQRDSVEMARLINAGARMMSAYQGGMLTINRLRTGGQQIVTVQHVNISGGQAVVAGTVQPGGNRNSPGEEK